MVFWLTSVPDLLHQWNSLLGTVWCWVEEAAEDSTASFYFTEPRHESTPGLDTGEWQKPHSSIHTEREPITGLHL